MKCETPDYCNDVNFPQNMCEVCLAFIEEQAIKNAANFGIPEQLGCSQCQQWFNYVDFLAHPCVKTKNAKIK